MEGIGAEVSQKIRSAIKAKLMEIGVYVDEELPDYVMVMVANKRSKDQMDEDLQLFLGQHTSLFTTWLHQVLQKLQEVTVANLGGIKRKLSEDSKLKKKKSKQDLERKGQRKKIKIEPEEETKVVNKEKKDVIIEYNSDSVSVNHEDIIENKTKENVDSVEKIKETKSISNIKNTEETIANIIIKNQNHQQKSDNAAARSKSTQPEDLDDEDCINIRTDGELLDTAEETNIEEHISKHTEEKELTCVKSNHTHSEKKSATIHLRPSNKLKSSDHDNTERLSNKQIIKKQPSPHQSSPQTNDKVVDARELLNRKKAAKQTDIKTHRQSKERSVSPPRKRRDDDRNFARRASRGEDKESSRRISRGDERDRRRIRDRDYHSSKLRGEDRLSRRIDSDRGDSRDKKKRDSSSEPPPKRIALERPFRNKVDDWNSARSAKLASISENRKVEIEASVNKRELEDVRKRSGLASQVVPRTQEPEDDVETPVPSVVKVTPRPRRPPSQQPSSTLIMKAISEANKSLANVPQRPDSTQRGRKGPVFTRTLRQLERIPPEKIAVSITNPLAHQNNDFPKNEISNNEELNNEEKVKNEIQLQDLQEPEIELETPELEISEEPIEEMSDPQFVVTLNGYDPDGLYSQGELDLDEEGECNDWLKENTDEEPLLTSTPHEVESPRTKRERNTSPIVIMSTPAVNHSNLIEVELVKTKSSERCKYWPACRLADKCTYYHPSKPCKLFPACKFGDACLYIHPQCKFNALCTRKDCVFAHNPAHTPLQQPSAVPKPKVLYAASAAPQPCKFYPNCTNINCQFTHPTRACRFGLYCTKKDCSFDHGQVAPVEKLKWTRLPTT